MGNFDPLRLKILVMPC